MYVIGHDDIFINVCILMFCIDIVDRGDVGIAPYRGPRGVVGIAPYGGSRGDVGIAPYCLYIPVHMGVIALHIHHPPIWLDLHQYNSIL